MANLEVLDGSGFPRYLKSGGVGTDLDPHVPVHDVNIQDQHSRVVDLLLMSPIDSLTLTSDSSLDDRTVAFDCLTTPTILDWVCLKQEGRWYQGVILDVVANGLDNYTITVDSPLDYAFTIAGHEACGIASTSLNVDGSITPVHFYVTPPLNTEWDIVRVIFSMSDVLTGDDSTFGGQDALTNGVVLRKVDGEYNNIFNAKANGAFGLRNFDFTYTEADKFGVYGYRTRRTFGGQNKNGVTVRLVGDSNDRLEVIIQDDLSGLSQFKVCAQGHVVE